MSGGLVVLAFAPHWRRRALAAVLVALAICGAVLGAWRWLP